MKLNPLGKEPFRHIEAGGEVFQIFQGELLGEEGPGGGLSPRDPRLFALRPKGGQKDIAVGLERPLLDHRPRGEDPHHRPFQKLFSPPWGLKLRTEGHFVPAPKELLHIELGPPHRHPGHGHPIPARQGDLQLPGNELRILKEGLVEIPKLEKEDGLGVPGLHLPVLPHHGRELPFHRGESNRRTPRRGGP